MVEPQRIVKDSVLSIVTIDNFAENVVSGSYYRISLSPAADQQWWLIAKKNTVEGIEYLSLFIRIGDIYAQNYSAEVGISLKNENSTSSESKKFTFDYPSNQFYGFPQFIEMSRVLAENNGFSRNGALIVQCEVRVNVITDHDGFRMFNFHDPFEGCVRFKMKNSQKTFYAMKKMVMYHSPMLAKKIANGEEKFPLRRFFYHSGEDFEWFLQLIHGLAVVHLPPWTLANVVIYAFDFGTFDIILRSEPIFTEFASKHHNVRTERERVTIFRNGFHHIILKQTLKRVKSLEEVKEVVECETDSLDSEAMKALACKIFSFAVDFREGPKKSV